MKNQVVLFLSLFLCLSVSSAKSPKFVPSPKVSEPSKLSRFNPEDQRMLGRIVSFMLLQKVKGHFETFVQNRDESALSELLKSWNPEERMEIKKELMAGFEKPSFRVDGSSLFISLREQEVELKVENPFEGVFQINGQRIRINPESKYKYFKEQFDALSIVSHKPSLFEFLIPRAEAGPATLAPKIGSWIAKYLKPASAAAGGAVKGEAAATGDSVGDAFMEMARAERKAPSLTDKVVAKGKQAAKFVGVTVAGGFVANTAFSCFAISWDWNTMTNTCIKSTSKLVGATLCDAKIRTKNCVEEVGALDAQVKKSSNSAPPPIVPLNVTDGKCMPTEDGFAKDVTRWKLDSAEIARTAGKNPGTPIVSLTPIVTTAVHIEYQKVENSKKLNFKTVTEVMTSNRPPTQGKVVMQRVWNYIGDNWSVATYGPITDAKGNFVDVSKVPTKTLKCVADKMDDACKTVYEDGVGGMGEAKNCDLGGSAVVPASSAGGIIYPAGGTVRTAH
jgi:hypothetical protein